MCTKNDVYSITSDQSVEPVVLKDFDRETPPDREECRRLLTAVLKYPRLIGRWNHMARSVRIYCFNNSIPVRGDDPGNDEWGPDLSCEEDPWEFPKIKTWSERDLSDSPELNLAFANLSHAEMERADFRHVCLVYADLSHSTSDHADYSSSYLEGSDFTGSSLVHAQFCEAHSASATFTNAKMKYAKMQRVKGESSFFLSSDLDGVDFEGSELDRSFFDGASMHYVNLKNCSLRDCVLGSDRGNPLVNTVRYAFSIHKHIRKGNIKRDINFFLFRLPHECWHKSSLGLTTNLDGSNLSYTRLLTPDGQSAVNAKFSPRSSDPYSVVRRKYTGPLMLFNLLFLVMFFAPYVIRAGVWTAIDRIQGIDIGRRVSSYSLSEQGVEFADRSVFLAVLGFESSFWGIVAGSLSVLFVTYNIMRAWITWWLSQVRDAEERSGHLPEMREYWWCYMLHHYFMRYVFWGAVLSFLFHFVRWMSATVSIPTALA